MDEWPSGFRRRSVDLIAGFDQSLCLRGTRLRIVINGAKRLARRHFVSNLLVQLDSNRGINGVLLLLSPATKHDAGLADLFALDRCNISCIGSEDLDLVQRARQFWLVENGRISALQLNHFSKRAQRFSRVDEFGSQFFAGVNVM